MDELFAKFVRGEMSVETYENGGKPKSFEAGARVELVGEYDEFDRLGAKGTIVEVGRYQNDALVEWDDDWYGFHDGGGRVPSGRGYWVLRSCMKFI